MNKIRRKVSALTRHYDYLISWSPAFTGPLAYRHATMTALGVSAKCPCCQQYSLTYDWQRHAFRCHVYGATITAEQLSRMTQS